MFRTASNPTSAASRPLLWALVCCLLGGVLFESFHTSTTPHRVCEDHDQVEHGDAHHGGGVEVGHREGVIASPDSGEADLHAACGIGEFVREQWGPVPAASMVPGRPQTLVRPLVPRTPMRAPAVAVLRLSPKHSPPA